MRFHFSMTMLKFKEKKEISDSMMMDYSRRYRADGFKPARGREKKKIFCADSSSSSSVAFHSLENERQTRPPADGLVSTQTEETSGAHHKEEKEKKRKHKMRVDTLTLLFV
jgi:hypothetical protein